MWGNIFVTRQKILKRVLMMKNTTVGVDLAKEVIQVCIYTNKKVHSNVEMTHHEFLAWLFKSKPTFIVFESCGMSSK